MQPSRRHKRSVHAHLWMNCVSWLSRVPATNEARKMVASCGCTGSGWQRPGRSERGVAGARGCHNAPESWGAAQAHALHMCRTCTARGAGTHDRHDRRAWNMKNIVATRPSTAPRDAAVPLRLMRAASTAGMASSSSRSTRPGRMPDSRLRAHVRAAVCASGVRQLCCRGHQAWQACRARLLSTLRPSSLDGYRMGACSIACWGLLRPAAATPERQAHLLMTGTATSASRPCTVSQRSTCHMAVGVGACGQKQHAARLWPTQAAAAAVARTCTHAALAPAAGPGWLTQGRRTAARPPRRRSTGPSHAPARVRMIEWHEWPAPAPARQSPRHAHHALPAPEHQCGPMQLWRLRGRGSDPRVRLVRVQGRGRHRRCPAGPACQATPAS